MPDSPPTEKNPSPEALAGPPPRPCLRLHRRLYPARCVQAARAAFAEIAEAQVAREGDYHRVTLRVLDDQLHPDEVLREFANYALGRAAEAR